MRVTKPLNLPDPNEIDFKDGMYKPKETIPDSPAIAESTVMGHQNHEREHSASAAGGSAVGPLPKELEKDFFTYILNNCDINQKLKNMNKRTAGIIQSEKINYGTGAE